MPPRLPDDSILGGLPSGNSGRSIASFDTTAPARAMETLGKGIKDLGSGIASGVQSLVGEQDEMALLKAQSGYAVDRAGIDERREKATTREELEAIDKEHQAAVQKWGSTLRGKNAEKWNLSFAPKVAEYGVKVREKAFNIEKNKAFAETNDMIDLMRELIIDPEVDDDRRQLAIETAGDMLLELKNKGYIDDLEYQKRSKQWVENYTSDRFKMLPADERAYAAGGLEGGLIGRESGGRPWIVNDFGFAGLYQFGAPRLQTLGLYQPGSSEDLGNWDKSSRGAPGKWSGTFNIPGFPQVKTLQDFLNTPGAQRKAWEVHNAYMDKEITSRGMDAYIGKTIGGVLITRDGIKAMIHLGGAGGAKRVLDSGGANNPQDANGTSLLNYAKMASRSDGGMINILPPDKREALKQQAFKELADQRDTTQQNRKVEESSVRSLIGEDTASIAATGKAIDGLTTDRVRMALGDEEAMKFERNREHAQRYHGTTKNFEGMSPDDMAEALKNMDPRLNGEAGKPGFKDAMEWFEKATKKRDAVIEERNRDPAAFADKQPETKEVKGSADLNDPKTYGPLVARRIAAQSRLGIIGSQQRYFTQAETTALMEPFDNAISTSGQLAALRQLVTTLQGVFGDDREKIEKSVSDIISKYNVSKDEKQILAAILTKIGKGEPVTQNDKQEATSAAATGAQERASSGILNSIMQGAGAVGVGVAEVPPTGAEIAGQTIAKAGRMTTKQTEQLWDTIGTPQEEEARQAFVERFGKDAVEAAVKARPQTWNPDTNKKFAKGPPKPKGEPPMGSGGNQYDKLQQMRERR